MVRRLALVAALVVVYFAVRFPYLSDPLWGEEGMFAHILLAAPASGETLLIGRLNGEPQYCSPEHPVALYKTIGLAGEPFKVVFPGWKTMPEYDFTRALRFTFSLFLLTVLAAILWVAYPHDSPRDPSARCVGPFALIVAVAISPLAVTKSVGLQIDAGTGLLMMGVLPVIVLAFRNGWISGRAFVALAGLGGALTGLGKIEWTLALLAAVLVALVYTILLARRDRGQPTFALWALGAVLAGLVLGNAASYLYDPINHAGGFGLLVRIVRESGYAQTGSLGRYAELLGKTLHVLLTPFLLVFLLAATAPRWLRGGDIWIIFLTAYGLALLVGFVLSPYVLESRDPRYFVPALVVLLCAGVAAFPPEGGRWLRAVGATVILGIAIPSVLAILQHFPEGRALREASDEFDARVDRAVAGTHCLPILRPDQGYLATFDFVSETIPEKYQQSFAMRVGKPLCLPFGYMGAPGPALLDDTVPNSLKQESNTPLIAQEPLVLLSIGPSSTEAGKGFNLQPNGESAMWAQGEGITASTIIVFNNVPLHGYTSGTQNSITTPLPNALFAATGEFSVYLLDTKTGGESNRMYFKVNE